MYICLKKFNRYCDIKFFLKIVFNENRKEGVMNECCEVEIYLWVFEV